MSLFDRVDRLWLEVDGVAIGVYPVPQSIELTSETVKMRFRRSPEIGAIAQGRRFKMSEGPRFVGMFEAVVRSGSGSLIPEKQGYSINQEDLESAEITAYYLPTPESRNSITVEIVPSGAATGGNKIAINPNNSTIQASPALEGKTIKLHCVYPQAIVLLDQKIESIVAHFVGDRDGSFYYARAPVEIITGTAKLLKVKILNALETIFLC